MASFWDVHISYTTSEVGLELRMFCMFSDVTSLWDVDISDILSEVGLK